MLDYSISPSWWLAVFEKDGTWTAMGSRKVNQIDIEARMEDYEWPLFSTDFQVRGVSNIVEYKIGGSVRSFTYCNGTTRLSALGALMDALQKEEEEERAEKADRVKRQADRERFGGEVNEELVRKIVRWRKKQAKKAAEYDPDGEWEF